MTEIYKEKLSKKEIGVIIWSNRAISRMNKKTNRKRGDVYNNVIFMFHEMLLNIIPHVTATK
jgi:hypothetical protein